MIGGCSSDENPGKHPSLPTQRIIKNILNGQATLDLLDLLLAQNTLNTSFKYKSTRQNVWRTNVRSQNLLKSVLTVTVSSLSSQMVFNVA